jgi:hypothetical protein
MASCPNIIVCLPSSEKVAEFRRGLGDTFGIIAIGPANDAMGKLAGIDAFYLSLGRAERWGSRPIPPHTVAVLHTSQTEQQSGIPPFVITGFLLKEGETPQADTVLPLLFNCVLDAVAEVNVQQPGAIRTIGFFAFELTAGGLTSLANAAQLLSTTVKKRIRK